MVIFNTEYVPELKWTMIKPYSEKNNVDKRINALKCKSRSNDIPKDPRHRHHQYRHNVITDFQSILNVINLIEKMIKYNNIYYERIEKRRRQQNLELQVLTMFLQNVYNDLKDI